VLQLSSDSKLGPGISVEVPGSLDVPGTSQNEPKAGLAIHRTVEGFPGSFNAPWTRLAGP
jgi:hypothetical protein